MCSFATYRPTFRRKQLFLSQFVFSVGGVKAIEKSNVSLPLSFLPSIIVHQHVQSFKNFRISLYTLKTIFDCQDVAKWSSNSLESKRAENNRLHELLVNNPSKMDRCV
jgi:hypothetical protein